MFLESLKLILWNTIQVVTPNIEKYFSSFFQEAKDPSPLFDKPLKPTGAFVLYHSYLQSIYIHNKLRNFWYVLLFADLLFNILCALGCRQEIKVAI